MAGFSRRTSVTIRSRFALVCIAATHRTCEPRNRPWENARPVLRHARGWCPCVSVSHGNRPWENARPVLRLPLSLLLSGGGGHHAGEGRHAHRGAAAARLQYCRAHPARCRRRAFVVRARGQVAPDRPEAGALAGLLGTCLSYRPGLPVPVSNNLYWPVLGPVAEFSPDFTLSGVC
jgi:hypothetical protein